MSILGHTFNEKYEVRSRRIQKMLQRGSSVLKADLIVMDNFPSSTNASEVMCMLKEADPHLRACYTLFHRTWYCPYR